MSWVSAVVSVAAARQASTIGKYNQAVQNRNAQVAEQEAQAIEQQKNLMGTLNEMAPALKDARETLDNMNLPSMDDMTKLFKKINKK